MVFNKKLQPEKTEIFVKNESGMYSGSKRKHWKRDDEMNQNHNHHTLSCKNNYHNGLTEGSAISECEQQ